MNIKRHTEYKVENGKLYKGVRNPLDRTNIGTCPFCEIPVYASSGQLITMYNNRPTHKGCRKEFEKGGKLDA